MSVLGTEGHVFKSHRSDFLNFYYVEYAGLFENQVKAILPEIYFATFGILIAVFGSFVGTSKTLNYPLTYKSILLMCASSLIIGIPVVERVDSMI